MNNSVAYQGLFAVFPVEEGKAKKLPDRWNHVLDWLAEHDSNAHGLALAWHVDGDTLQNYYDADLKADGFYDVVSDTICDSCSDVINPGSAFYRMNYLDGTDQFPMCYKCATEAMEECVIEVTGNRDVVVTARTAAAQLKISYWGVLGWVIARKVSNAHLLHSLGYHFSDGLLFRAILNNWKMPDRSGETT